MNKSSLTILTTVVLSLSGVGAESINLFNTGVDSFGVPLPDNSIDPHYSITFPTAAPGIVAAASGGWPIPPWLGDNTTSAWVTPATDTRGPHDKVYHYTTTFDLTGMDPSSAFISGQWAGDDGGVGGLSDIILNGNSTLQFPEHFISWTSFSLNSGFISGINTLSFQIKNYGGGPTGIRVEMRGKANGVPEAGSAMVLLGISLMGIETLRRRVIRES